MSSTSGSSFVGIRWLFQSDDIVPISGLDAFAEIRFGSMRLGGGDLGEQRMRYRSTTRRRLAVSAELTCPVGTYTETRSISDSISADGAMWAHEGESRVGTRVGWGKGFAGYRVRELLPSVEVRVKIRSHSPFDRPLNAAGLFQIE